MTYPVSFSYSESGSFLHVRFKELVGEMLCKKGEHQAGALGVRDELSSHQNLLCQKLRIRELLFS